MLDYVLYTMFSHCTHFRIFYTFYITQDASAFLKCISC